MSGIFPTNAIIMNGLESQNGRLPIVGNSFQLRFEFLFHFILLIMAVAVISMSFLMRMAGDSLVFLPGAIFPLPASCAARQLFGIECPGCGLTRAFISISHGQWSRAWHFNPASFLVYAFVVGQVPWRCFQMWRIATHRYPLFSVWLFLPLAMVVGVLLLQWIIKLVGI